MQGNGHEHGTGGGRNPHHHAAGAHETHGAAGGAGGHGGPGADLASGGGGSQELLTFAGWNTALALVALAGLAFVAWRSRRGLDPLPAVALAAGIVVACLAAASPLGSLVARGSHLAYMLQLELLLNVAPPLFAVGLLAVLRPAGFLPAKDDSRAYTVAAAGLGFWLLAMYVPHLPAVHSVVLGFPTAYALQLAGFVLAGTLFWLPVVGSGGMSLRGKLAYLAFAQVGAGLLAALLIWSPGLVYDHQHGVMPFGLSAVADQRLSGVVMMVMDMLAASTAAGWLFVRAAARPERRLRPATE